MTFCGSPRALITYVVVALLVVGGACGSSADDPADGDGRTAAMYESILEWVLEAVPTPADDEDLPVIYVVSRAEDEIDIDVQVAVIEALEPVAVIRFADSRDEAVDDEEPNRPVRADAVLVGLGAVPPEGDEVDVYAERYHDADDIDAWEVPLSHTGDRWALRGEPPTVDVRPLPDGD